MWTRGEDFILNIDIRKESTLEKAKVKIQERVYSFIYI